MPDAADTSGTRARFRPVDVDVFRTPLPHPRLPFHEQHLGSLQRLPTGHTKLRGLPFSLGTEFVIVDRPLEVPVADEVATHVLFAHVCPPAKDEPATAPEWDLMARAGEPLARYWVVHADGTDQPCVIRRRFEVNEWTSSLEPISFASVSDRRHRRVDWRGPHARQARPTYGRAGSSSMAALPGSWGANQTGVSDDRGPGDPFYWIFAVEVATPEKAVASIRLEPWPDADQWVLLGGITVYRGETSPLTYGPARTLRISFPNDDIDENVPIDVDVGVVGERSTWLGDLDTGAWLAEGFRGWGSLSDRSGGVVLVDVAAAPDAVLDIDGQPIGLDRSTGDGTSLPRIEVLPPRDRRVHVTVLDGATGRPTPCRVHFRSADGRYLPPAGHRAEVNPGLMEDYGADIKLGDVAYAYVDGSFDINLPRTEVVCEIVKGFEHRPLRERIDVGDKDSDLVLQLQRPIDFRREGWVSADTHVHFVPPSTALLEANAEGLNMVHVLATQLGNVYSNVADFAAGPLIDAESETAVFMGTENRQPMLGHIGLLNTGRPIFPLATGGAGTSALGEPVEALMADWADQCRVAGGVVVSSHFPFPYGEIAADIVMGKIDAIEIFGFPEVPEGPRVRDWYRFLNAGYSIPLVSGTDKLSAGTPVGALRTYARLEPGEPFGFDAWARAVRGGRTFGTSGPLLHFTVDGREPGDVVELPRTGGTVTVEASATSVNPLASLELVVNGSVIASTHSSSDVTELHLADDVEISGSSWLAARCGTRDVIPLAFPTGVAAHSSPVYAQCETQRRLRAADASLLLTLIEGAREWMRSLAVVASEDERQRFLSFFASAREELQARLDAKEHA